MTHIYCITSLYEMKTAPASCDLEYLLYIMESARVRSSFPPLGHPAKKLVEGHKMTRETCREGASLF